MPRVALFMACLMLAACDLRTRPLPPPAHGGELVVLTRQSAVTYFENADGNPAGLEYELVQAFAARAGYRVKWLQADSVESLLDRLRAGAAHFAAAGLTATHERKTRLVFGPAYQSVQTLVLRDSSGPTMRRMEHLVGKSIEVVAGSSHVEDLKNLATKVPGLSWREVPVANSEVLLEHLASGLADAVVVDSNDFDIAQNFHPSLRIAFAIGTARPLGWAFPRGTDRRLIKEVQDFFAAVQKSGELARLNERYFGHVDRLTEADVTGILDKRATLLARFRPMFQRAQGETGLDWRLLAALGYQESHWDPGAVSPTGVRGLMMLTADTADRLGVKNRLDPAESTLAAARYLAALKSELPDSVPEPERTWFALAAYNVGMAHVMDARRLAERLGKDADKWADMKTVLPLLSRSQHHRTLAHGFARGGEAMVMVENIRTYFDILARFEPAFRPGWGGPYFDHSTPAPH